MIYLELVPTSLEKLSLESHWALNTFKEIKGINIPDILRISTRSFDAAAHIAKDDIDSIPHIRICDFNMSQLSELCHKLSIQNVSRILLISGDPPPNPLQPVFKHNIIEIIKELSTQFKSINFYAGCDPYRQSIRSELNYSEEKIKAGAMGLFTQPIFDINLAKILINSSITSQWFLGISPVLTEKSYNYWVTRNNVFFNSKFERSLDYNINIGKDMIELCKTENHNNYIMPIKTDLQSYLKGLLT
ncbi:MAG: methylenetetrahydrofolate reductase [Candidatus Margulisiibacteriota bacterium]